MSFAIRFVLVFIVVGLSSACGVRYISFANSGKAAKAANIGILMLALNHFSFLSWWKDKWLLAAVYSADWLGTYLTIKYSSKNK